MKTYIVQLEDHDDILSARDKISWSKATRVLLVWPRKGRVLDRRVDLLLLQRHGQQLGVQLAVVTRSGEVKGYARELGIAVFDSPVQAQKSTWLRLRARRKPAWLERKPAQPETIRARRLEYQREQNSGLLARLNQHRWYRLAAFAIGVLSFLALVLFFAPGAEIELTPIREPQELTLTVWASPEIPVANPSGGLPAQVLTAVVEGREQASSTGRASIPDQTASGRVIMTNLTDQPLEVPAGSVALTLSTPAVRFETTRAAQIPAGPGQSVDVPVQAALPGSRGNVSAGRILALEGPLGLRVTVENPEPTRGGSDRASPAPSQQDYRELRQKLLAELEQTALEELRGTLEPGQVLLDETIHLREVIEDEREPSEGQPADRLQLTLQVEFEAWTVQETDLQAVAQVALEANRKKDYQAVPGSLRYAFSSRPALDENAGQSSADRPVEARWQINVEREVQMHWTENQVIETVLGRGVEEARQALQASLPLAEPPRIDLYPAWWVRMPFLPARIVLVEP